MKKFLFAALMLLALPNASQAQNLGNILGKVASAVTSNSSSSSDSSLGSSLLGNIVGNLLGTSKVSKSSLAGTWVYSKPAIVFESSNIAGKLAGTAIESKAEKQLSSILTKAGFKKGKVTITFDKDGNYSANVAGKTLTGTYKLDGSTLILSKGNIQTLKTNVSISGSELQLAMDADKLSTVVNGAVKVASSMSSTISTLSKLLGSTDGMKVGMKFSKQ